MIMKTIKLLAIGASLFTSVTAMAADNYLCTNAGSERSVKVIYQAPGVAVPCEVQYTKDGVSQTLWTAENLTGYCEEKAQAFADKLSGWGWQCNQLGDEMMDASEEDMTPAEGADGN